uniref:Serine/threonine-protein kinase MAK n=1 Tax=Ganoderma boninense TaxID=34458 RepID=A0A5K1JTC3_9APHY|nr:Serine/threonine-protein kinase MAK [Ganoderma boninense]
MTTGFDIWGVVASVIGLLNFFQFIAAVIRSRLPRGCIRDFDDTLEETEGLLRSVEEEGLFAEDGGHYLSSTEAQIASDALAAQTLSQELTQWWRGLSKHITVCSVELKNIRAGVSTTSNERREALAQRQTLISLVNSGDSAQPDTSSSLETFEDASSSNSDGLTSEPQQLVIEETKELAPTEDDQAHLVNATSPSETRRTSRSSSDLEDTLPSYRRQSSLPPYASSPSSSTTVITRYTVTSADAARTTRKLVRAYRRRLMVRNVPWNSQETQHPHHALSAAASASAADRPSNAKRHWKLLEARAKSGLHPYVTVLSYEAPAVASSHAVGTV